MKAHTFNAGDVVRSVSDSCDDIEIGHDYTVTDVSDDMIRFLDDNNDDRWRHASDYELADTRYFVFAAPVSEFKSHRDALAEVKAAAAMDPPQAYYLVPAAKTEAYKLVTAVQRVD